MDGSRRAGIGQWHEYDHVACNKKYYCIYIYIKAKDLFLLQQIMITVTSCVKAAANVHFFDFSGKLLYETG